MQEPLFLFRGDHARVPWKPFSAHAIRWSAEGEADARAPAKTPGLLVPLLSLGRRPARPAAPACALSLGCQPRPLLPAPAPAAPAPPPLRTEPAAGI